MIPSFGLGTYTVQNEECIDIVSNALKIGYKLIDTAELYKNHKEISIAIEKSGQKREDIWITSKIHNKDQRHLNISCAIDKILKDLNTDYLDLLLLHSAQKNYIDAYAELVRCKEHFNIKNIGVSNFRIHELENIDKKTGILPYLNQIEIHPFNQRIELRKYMDSQKIITQSYGSLTGIDSIKNPLYKSDDLLLNWSLYYDLHPIPTSHTLEHLMSNFDSLNKKIDDISICSLNYISEKIIKYKQHSDLEIYL